MGFEILVAEMFDDGFAHPFPQKPRAVYISEQVEGAFVDADIGMFVQLPQQDFGVGLLVAEEAANLALQAGKLDCRGTRLKGTSTC